MNTRKSTVEKPKSGTLRKDRDAPKFKHDEDYSFPECPSHIKGEVRKVWNDVKKEMTTFAIITGADKAILEQYCFLMAKLRSNPDDFTAPLHAQLRGLSSDPCLTPDIRAIAKLVKVDKDAEILSRYEL